MKKLLVGLMVGFLLFVGSLSFTSVEKTYWEYENVTNFQANLTRMHYAFYEEQTYFILAHMLVLPLDLWGDKSFYCRGFSFITVTSEVYRGVILSFFYGDVGFALEFGAFDRPLRGFFELYKIQKLGDGVIIKKTEAAEGVQGVET